MADNEIILRVPTIPNSLGPFAKDTPCQVKWRTTEQLANALWDSDAHHHLEHLDELLTQYEAKYRHRIESGLKPDALIRCALS
jgi:hypothetical protein